MSAQQEEAAHADRAFTLAVDIITTRLPRSGPVQPDYSTKLRLYSLFKQANDGDISTPRPGLLDLLGRAKHDAWKSRKGMSSVEAKLAYVKDLAHLLKAADNPQAKALLQELQAQTPSRQPAASETESGSTDDEEESGSEETSQDEVSQAEVVQQQQQSGSLVGAARRERERARMQSDLQAEEQHETIAPLRSHMHHSVTSLPTSSYATLPPPSAPARSVRSSGSRTPAAQLQQSLAVSSTQLKQEWLAEQQWRQSQDPAAAAATQSMTEAHLQAHNRTLSRPAISPRPTSVRPVPVPLEITLQAIHTSLQTLHQRISDLEQERYERSAASFWTLFLASFTSRGSSGGTPRRSWSAMALSLWDHSRDLILFTLVALFLFQRRRQLLPFWWSNRLRSLMPKYRLKLVQAD